MKKLWCSLVMAPVIALAPPVSANPPNDTPDLTDGIQHEPYSSHLGVVGAKFALTMADQGYVLYQRVGTFGSPVTISKMESDLNVGYGVWCMSSHGSTSGMAVEAYPLTPAGLTARNNALNGYARYGSGIYSAQGAGGYHISVTPDFINQYFYSFKSFVFNGACWGSPYNWSWRNARVVIAYPDTHSNVQTQNDIQMIFSAMNGEIGRENRVLERARIGTATQHEGNLKTVLSPTIISPDLPSRITARGEYEVRFDTPIDQNVPAWKIVKGTGTVQAFNRRWTPDGVGFTLKGRAEGFGNVEIVAYNVDMSVYDGVRSVSGLVGLDGNGLGPNRDSKHYQIQSAYRDDIPAAFLCGFAAVRKNGGITAIWEADECNTSAYLVEYAPEFTGPYTIMATVPATGGHATYRRTISDGLPGWWRLREVETDGDTLEHASDLDRAPLTAEPPTEFSLADLDSLKQAARQNMPKRAMMEGLPTQLVIYVPSRRFQGSVEYLADFKTNYEGVPTQVAYVDELPGGELGMKADNAQRLPSGGAVMWWGRATEQRDVDGRAMRSNDSLFTALGFTKTSYLDQPGHFHLHYEVEADSMEHSIAYWTPYIGSPIWVVDQDGDGRPDHGRSIGIVPITADTTSGRDTTEAWQFAIKIAGTAYQDPYAPIEAMGYFRDAAGNSGPYAQARHDSLVQLIQQLSMYAEIRKTYDTPQDPLTLTECIAASNGVLNEGRSMVMVGGTTAHPQMHLAGFWPVWQGYNGNGLTANAGRTPFLFAPICGAGGDDYTDNPAQGMKAPKMLWISQNGGISGYLGANRGTTPDGNYAYAEAWLTRQYSTPWQEEPPTLGELWCESMWDVATNHPEHLRVAKSMILYGDPTRRLSVPRPSVVSVDRQSGFRPGLTIAPNPSRQHAEFRFSTLQRGQVEISVFDVSGRRVTTVFHGRREAGQHAVAWHGQNLNPGVYFARLSVEDREVTRLRFVQIH